MELGGTIGFPPYQNIIGFWIFIAKWIFRARAYILILKGKANAFPARWKLPTKFSKCYPHSLKKVRRLYIVAPNKEGSAGP